MSVEDCREPGCVLILGHEGLHWNARDGGYHSKEKHAEVAQEHDRLARIVHSVYQSTYAQEHNANGKGVIESDDIAHDAVAQLLADYAAKVRLDEARLWNVWVANPFESIDHEYHVGFNARCGLCRAKHIAELERSASHGRAT